MVDGMAGTLGCEVKKTHLGQITIVSSPTGLFLGDWGKPENLDETHRDTKKTCEILQRQFRMKLGILEMWSGNDICCLHCALRCITCQTSNKCGIMYMWNMWLYKKSYMWSSCDISLKDKMQGIHRSVIHYTVSSSLWNRDIGPARVAVVHVVSCTAEGLKKCHP